MTTNTESNAAVSSRTDEKRFRDMLLPALIFYVAFTAMFMIFYVVIIKEPLEANLLFLPFIMTFANFSRDVKKDWGWLNGIKVVSFITGLAVSVAAIYQLAMDTVDIKMLALYPATAIALMATSWLITALGQTPPFQFKWFQRTIAYLLIAAAIAFPVYAYWLENFAVS